jgi:hypothetical protein
VPTHYSDGPGANALLNDTLLTVKFGVFIHLNTGTSVFGNRKTTCLIAGVLSGVHTFSKNLEAISKLYGLGG